LEIRGGSSHDYEEIIKKCQEEISLSELGIPLIDIRKARGGGIFLEIRSDKDEEGKAELLAKKIEEQIRGREGATVRCPLRRTRIRLVGLPFGAAATEVAQTVAEAGGVEARRIRVGPLRTLAFGAGTVWADCPVKAALRVVEAAGLTMGWARVRVSLERGKPPQCHRCLARGHLRRWCPSVDRGDCCQVRRERASGGVEIIRTARSVLGGISGPIIDPEIPRSARWSPPGVEREGAPRGQTAPSPDPGERSSGGTKGKGGLRRLGETRLLRELGPSSSLDPGEGSSEVDRVCPAAGECL